MIVRVESRILVVCGWVGLSLAGCSSTPVSTAQTSYPNSAGTTPAAVSGAGGATLPAGAPTAGAAKGAAGTTTGVALPVAGTAVAPVTPIAGAVAAIAGSVATGTAGIASGSGGVVSATAAGTGTAGNGGSLAAGSGSAAGASGSASSAPACTGMPLSPGDHEFEIDSKNGIKYTYILSVPKSVDATQRTPLLVHWHALSSSPEEARKLTSVDAKAEAAKWLVVYPKSPDESWDVGSCCTNIKGGTSRDETVFVRELMTDVLSKACVDEKRIYTNGFSNGGMIAQLLACKMPELFAAAAPMGSTLTIEKSMCSPSRPLPLFLINGTEDPLVGFTTPSSSGGLSVVDDQKFWAEKNGCTGTPEMTLSKGKVTCFRYAQCTGAPLEYCNVEGMGHCVPGMVKESETNCLTKTAFGLPIRLGPPDDDIDGIQMNFDFLARFTLK